MPATLIPVILSGGSGTRLWPLSRELQPKQFLPLVGERTMLQETVQRTRVLGNDLAAPIVVCNDKHRFLVAEQMRQAGARPETVVLEPAGRNTAPAVGVAARLAVGSGFSPTRSDAKGHSAESPRSDSPGPDAPDSDDPILLVLPADHVIGDVEAFGEAVRVALVAARRGYLVTFGVVPDRPETGYGYLQKGSAGGEGWYLLEQFVEKPDRTTAESYVQSGAYFWNSGMFVFSARRYLEELERHAPQIAATCELTIAQAERDQDFTRLGRAFLDCPSDSIDYAVMEKTQRAAVVPLDASWSDVGSWPALHEILDKDADGNVLRGDVIAEGCRDCYIASSTRLVAAVGAERFIIVETADAVLVMPHSAAQDVKRVVDELKRAERLELRRHPETEG